VERADDELLWLEGAQASFEPGEAISVDVSVAKDARYRAAFEVEVASAEHIAASPLGQGSDSGWKWERLQQRSLVRTETPRLEARIRRCGSAAPIESGGTRPTRGDRDNDGAEPQATYSVLDLSAGGMRIEASGGFEVGQDVVCDFELPDQPPYTLAGRVVRTDPEKNFVSLQFTDTGEYLRSKILRWIFREQVRLHRVTRPKPARESHHTPEKRLA